ncbi:MAG: hypothetical protein SNJ77_08820 [Cytophagales bacterium]
MFLEGGERGKIELKFLGYKSHMLRCMRLLFGILVIESNEIAQIADGYF